jgi:hypothetical protein
MMPFISIALIVCANRLSTRAGSSTGALAIASRTGLQKLGGSDFSK